MSSVVVGTEQGVAVLGDDPARDDLAGLSGSAPNERMTSLVHGESDWWAIAGDRSILRSPAGGEWKEMASLPRLSARCLSPAVDGLLVGTSEARLFSLRDGTLEPIPSFDRVQGRADWYTPWGGPPDTRSITVDVAGAIYVNVHVGGVVRSRDGGDTWEPTMDIDMDVHQVLSHPSRPGLVYAASARGLGISEDGAASWEFHTDGLHATYSRAVAVCEDWVLLSASTGPRGSRAALYRGPLDGSGPFERVASGVPEWFADNIDTFCLGAGEETAVCGTQDGTVYLSRDQGRTWSVAASGLPPVTCAVVA